MTVKIISLSLSPDMWCLKFLFLDTQSLPALLFGIISQNPEGKPSRVLPATPSEISSEIHSATPAEISTIFPPPILPGIRPNISSALFKGSSYKFLQSRKLFSSETLTLSLISIDIARNFCQASRIWIWIPLGMPGMDSFRYATKNLT